MKSLIAAILMTLSACHPLPVGAQQFGGEVSERQLDACDAKGYSDEECQDIADDGEWSQEIGGEWNE